MERSMQWQALGLQTALQLAVHGTPDDIASSRRFRAAQAKPPVFKRHRLCHLVPVTMLEFQPQQPQPPRLPHRNTSGAPWALRMGNEAGAAEVSRHGQAIATVVQL